LAAWSDAPQSVAKLADSVTKFFHHLFIKIRPCYNFRNGQFRELFSRVSRRIGRKVVNHDDRRLIADCLGGRRDAFGELVSRYQARLYNAAIRLVDNPDDAADVVQDAFLNAFQSLHTFKGDAEFFTWLYRIAFNTAISLKRKKRATISLDAGGPDGGIDPDDPSEYIKPGTALQRSEEETQLHEALARLSHEHREVLLMKDIDGMKYEEIAELLGVPIGTIRSRLHRARLELRDLLEAEDH
jgi:RNA polymerase sigma-70 factor (ECF subfamily)